jgi:hypothetical protein
MRDVMNQLPANSAVELSKADLTLFLPECIREKTSGFEPYSRNDPDKQVFIIASHV